MPQTRSYPWWLYLLSAGTDVFSKAIAMLPVNGKDGRRSSRGIRVEKSEALKPGIDPERITATSIIGRSIRGSDGKDLGKVEEVALDLTSGAVSYFVLSSGGFLGLGDKFYAVPLDTLTISPEEGVFFLGIDKKKLKHMPEFDKHNWPRKSNWPAAR